MISLLSQEHVVRTVEDIMKIYLRDIKAKKHSLKTYFQETKQLADYLSNITFN